MNAARGLFDGPPPRIRAAPASAPFLDVLADAMVGALVAPVPPASSRQEGDAGRMPAVRAGKMPAVRDPFALSDALVLLPNRRAARGLIDAFARRLGGAALLPTIRPLGDPHAEDDPDVWGADPIGEELAAPIDAMQRRMQLAALIRRRDKAQNGVEDPARAIALADELGKLLDSAATVERVAWEKLPKLVEEIELARHWESSAAFLDIVARFWPQHLKEQRLSDPAEHGAALRRALAARWRAEQPTRPIVIAGSTGSQATTRELMRVVAALPRGVVVLPGVDVDLDDESWAMVGDQHPQHALKATLEALGVARSDIEPLVAETAGGRARRVLMREALAPAEKTADWLARLAAAGGAEFVKRGAEGMRLVEARTEDEEATAIALILRETLEQEGARAAVVTPDAALARRIEAKLARWGIEPAVSHGSPLRETEAGRLIALLCELAHDASEPVGLAALLKHPRVTLARDARTLAALEHEALRGPRRYRSFAELAALGEGGGDEKRLAWWRAARAMVEATERALAPLVALMAGGETTLSAFADALSEAAEATTNFDVWRERDGEMSAQLLREASEHGAALGPMPASAAPRVLLRLMDGREVPPPQTSGEARVAIWGLLEARLQRRELMILAGLNEGVWPARAPEDPFLSRAMRDKLGLPSLDARIGLAAHDFAQLANAPNVVLTRALRRDGSPTLASRWLWRLQTLVKGAGEEAERAFAPTPVYVEWSPPLDQPQTLRTPRVPRPKPPARKRLKRLSVTQVETLIRDPYALYARRILGLEHLKPIGAPTGPAERGIAVHRAIELFEDGQDHARLSDLLDEQLQRAGVSPERRAAERERLAISVAALIAWFEERKAKKLDVYRETKGVLQLGDVELSGVADRIEIGAGHVAVLDFKTGAPATVKQVEAGLAPQLPLLAAMLAAGVFKEAAGGETKTVPAARATELGYWRFGNAEPTPMPLALDAMAEADKALSALKGLLARYAEADQAFLSKPRVLLIKPYDEYDQLARRKEWADAEGEE